MINGRIIMTPASFFSAHSYTFNRGIYPPANKSLSELKTVEVLPTPEQVFIPLLQHVGAVCESVVKPNAMVAVDDVVGDSKEFISAPVHASIPGKTARFSKTTLPNGRHVEVIPIKRDEEQSLNGQVLWDDYYGGEWVCDQINSYQPDDIVKAVKDAGVVGLGGAGFPTFVKLMKNDKKPVNTVLLNGCECEPYLTSDYRLMVEAPKPIICGALLVQRALDAEKVIICLEDNHHDAAVAIREAAKNTTIEVILAKTKYPQGGEKQLIKAVTGLEVPTGGLPADAGMAVINVGSAAAIARAVMRGKPLTHRVVTVTGRGIHETKNIFAPIGTPYRNLIDFCGGLTSEAARIVAGGPMMGFTLGSLDVPLTKGTSGITVLTHDEIQREEETACIRCGRCVDVCPMNLVPTKIALATRANNLDTATHYHIMSCVECGSCAYTCPSSIPLVQLIRTGKVMIRDKQH